MKTGARYPLSHPLTKGGIISFLVHFLVFNFIAISFPLQKSALNPNLVFLGPLFKKEEPGPSNKKYGLDTQTRNKKIILDKGTEKSAFTPTAENKPAAIGDQTTKKKTTLKTVFPLDTEAPPTDKQILKNLGIEETPKKYQRLKLPDL